MSTMITPRYAVTMAAYNAEMNRRVYAAAGRLSEVERKRARGAFWRSIHETLSHLVWADRTWMSRFAGWPKPPQPLADSGALFDTFEPMAADRSELDARLSEWCATLTPEWLSQTLEWYSSAVGGEVTKPRDLLVIHFFNHQTHHRGQAHAMITAAGQSIEATDLPFIDLQMRGAPTI